MIFLLIGVLGSIFIVLWLDTFKKKSTGKIYFFILRVIALLIGFAFKGFKHFLGGLLNGFLIISVFSFFTCIVWGIVLYFLQEETRKTWFKFAEFYLILGLGLFFLMVSLDKREKVREVRKNYQKINYNKGKAYLKKDDFCKAYFYFKKSNLSKEGIKEIKEKCIRKAKLAYIKGEFEKSSELFSFVKEDNRAKKYFKLIEMKKLLQEGDKNYIAGHYQKAIRSYENILQNFRNERALLNREEALKSLGKRHQSLFQKLKCILLNGDVYQKKQKINFDKLFYVSNASGKYEIWTYDLKKGKNNILTEMKKNNWNPNINYSLKKLYYVSDRTGNWDIFSYNFTTQKEEREVINNLKKSNPKVSDDGKWIAFSVIELNDIKLGVYDVFKKKTHIFTSRDLIYSGIHRWFGDKLYFYFYSKLGEGIQILDFSKGKGVKTIFKNDSFTEEEIDFNFESAICCSELVNNSKTKILEFVDFFTYGFEILSDDVFYDEPVFSPDGKFIAYTAYSGPNSDIYIYNLNKRKKRRVTSFNNQSFNPEW